MQRQHCDECDEEIRLTVSTLVQHSGCSRGCHSPSYTAKFVLACGCTDESPKATEMDSIRFSGRAPEAWTDG